MPNPTDPAPVSDPLYDIVRDQLRANAETYEVHYWPHTGRVLTVYLTADGEPRTTDLRIVNTGGRGTMHLADTTAVLAETLANAGNPQGGLVEHTPDGLVHVLYTQPGEDPVHRLPVTGITMPHPGYRITDDGGTLRLAGTIVGHAVRRPDTGRWDLDNPHRGEVAALIVELDEFAASCRDTDGLPVTLNTLLDALETEHQHTRPAARRAHTPEAR